MFCRYNGSVPFYVMLTAPLYTKSPNLASVPYFLRTLPGNTTSGFRRAMTIAGHGSPGPRPFKQDENPAASLLQQIPTTSECSRYCNFPRRQCLQLCSGKWFWESGIGSHNIGSGTGITFRTVGYYGNGIRKRDRICQYISLAC